MRIAVRLIATLFLLVSFAAEAEVEGVFTFGGALVRFDDGDDDAKPINIYGRLGAAVNRYIEFGFEGGLTLRDDEVGGADYDVSTLLLYLQGNLPIGNAGMLYVLGGPARTQINGTAVVDDDTGGGGSIILSGSADDTDIALGGGFRLTIRDNYFVSVDYIRYFDNDEFDDSEGDFVTDAINLGLGGFF